MQIIADLYNSLNQRKRPEDIAQLVSNALSRQLSVGEALTLKKAAQGSLSNNMFAYTSMMQEFAEVKGAGKQVRKAMEIFSINPSDADYSKAANIEAFILETSPIIHKAYGENDFKSNRLNKSQRKEAGLDLSKRKYNKKWRLLKRLEKKLSVTLREVKKKEFQMISKHGLVHRLDQSNFSSDLNTACFIAYYNARCNLRSAFTNTAQVRAFDEISDMLFNRCIDHKSLFSRLFKGRQPNENSSNWWAIAHIYPAPQVLLHLSDEQKGKLLGEWTTVLQEIAVVLDELWSSNEIDKQTMIVKRGNDSTTWNNTAGAWNKARDSWMNLIYSLGLEALLDEVCFGKVLRLMAADVVAWHHASSGGLDPNTNVWNQLPLPWDVFLEKEECNRSIFVSLCRNAGIDPEKSGWVAPRIHGVAVFTPTPELVHGVTVTNPFLATVLKRSKYYSGKSVKPFYPENN